MKIIIMAGGDYNEWETPKQLIKINGEVLIERTIRQLKENGIKDIAISTNNKAFDYLDVDILHHENKYNHNDYKKECTDSNYSWINAYYPTNQEVCYLHGDVYFSDEAIKTIVNTEVEDTMFICTCDGTDRERHPLNQKGREPFGYIVKNQVVFQYAIKKIKQMVDAGMFKDNLTPISWHLYRFLNGYGVKPYAKEYTEVNNIFQNIGDYLIIDDYTVDIDTDRDIDNLENILKER